jgi:hypothetical protein
VLLDQVCRSLCMKHSCDFNRHVHRCVNVTHKCIAPTMTGLACYNHLCRAEQRSSDCAIYTNKPLKRYQSSMPKCCTLCMRKQKSDLVWCEEPWLCMIERLVLFQMTISFWYVLCINSLTHSLVPTHRLTARTHSISIRCCSFSTCIFHERPSSLE